MYVFVDFIGKVLTESYGCGQVFQQPEQLPALVLFATVEHAGLGDGQKFHFSVGECGRCGCVVVDGRSQIGQDVDDIVFE